MPKEITKAELENEKIELENRQRELTLVDSYELMANKSAEKAVELQKKLQKHEKDIELLKDTIKDLLAYKKEQEETIKQQNLRIDKQEKQIKSLTKELSMTQTYNYALIQQMKKENITPISPSSIDISEYKNGINGK
jgi:ABC-type Fe3+-citrate transport system substrate-binding protein